MHEGGFEDGVEGLLGWEVGDVGTGDSEGVGGMEDEVGREVEDGYMVGSEVEERDGDAVCSGMYLGFPEADGSDEGVEWFLAD